MRAPFAALIIIALSGATALAQPGGLPPERLEQNFQRLDLNVDGVLTADEFAQVRADNFGLIDGNGDGFIAEGEMMGYRGEGRGKYLSRRQFELRRKAFYKMDKNLDRFLSLDEYLFKAKLSFNSLDANRDGQVTFEEFSRPPVTARR